jgi:hypothetical protein
MRRGELPAAKLPGGAGTLRQVFYRLVAAKLIENSENDYKHLSRKSAGLRRDGLFPPLLDRTCQIELPPTWSSPAEALVAIARQYRRDLLATQDVLPVVVEKATLIAQVVSWFGGLCVPAVALRGYVSEMLERLVSELADADHRQFVFLYAGDFDPTGEDIPRAFEQNTGLSLRRVALTAGQVDEYGLLPAPGKASDSRAAGFEAKHGPACPGRAGGAGPGRLADTALPRAGQAGRPWPRRKRARAAEAAAGGAGHPRRRWEGR